MTGDAINRYTAEADRDALYTATKLVRRGNVDAIRAVVEENPLLVNQQDKTGMTLLMHIAIHNQDGVAKYLLKPNRLFKADVDLVDSVSDCCELCVCWFVAVFLGGFRDENTRFLSSRC